jgi:hypothetical protein
MKRLSLLILCSLTITSCIAGGARDDRLVRDEAHNYKGYISLSVEARCISEKAKDRYTVEQLFNDYKHTVTVDQDGYGEIEDNKISFVKQKLSITNKYGNYEVQLPYAFYFSQLRGCLALINKKTIFVFVVRTRASTSRRFVGLVDLRKMEPLFLQSLPSEDVSDIIIDKKIVKILGCDNGIELKFKL